MPRAEKTGVQFAAVAFLAVTLVLAIAAVAAAYTQDVYVSSYFHNQNDNC